MACRAAEDLHRGSQGADGAVLSRFGGVRDYLRECGDQARKDGYTSTVLGRRRYLPELDSSNRNVREAAERAALNAPIQGSAADIIKVAMINVDQALKEAGLKSGCCCRYTTSFCCSRLSPG
jgi:DNA polymerase I-like protein with 3'-5' exonuclease and polymerase domains